mmetsp:Transcript_43112/g.104333  ORF Transcript_43112/g.104333 Transcript_43112/m.104333 type:complete len:294 (+) Transcript_43112:143-1024(+)
MEGNTIYMEKYDSSGTDDHFHVNDYDPSTNSDEVYSDLLQDDDSAGAWFPKMLRQQPIVSWLIKVVERAISSISEKSGTTSTVSMILIVIVLLLAPLGILGFFDSADPGVSYGEMLYRSILRLIDTIWSLCMTPFDVVLRLMSPASYSPLLADEDDAEEVETVKVPSARSQILRSLVSKTQQTMPPLVPIPGAQEELPKKPNLKQSQPPPELEPAFLNPEDYPPGWLVFHPELGVVSKEEADAYDHHGETNQASENETDSGAKTELDDDDAKEPKDISHEETTNNLTEDASTS